MSKLQTVCKNCGGPKSHRVRKDRAHLESWCPPCNSAKAKAFYKRNPGAKKKYAHNLGQNGRKDEQLRAVYNISLNDYNLMLRLQDDKCKTCKKHKSEFKRSLAVDHDHTTGKIRGLLCDDCNISLGRLKENFETLLNLAKYIQEHKGII